MEEILNLIYLTKNNITDIRQKINILDKNLDLLERCIEEENVVIQGASIVENPPEETRAFFRGKCLQKWPDKVLVANWDSIVFDTGDQNLQRVPMMEPLKGTSQHVGDLIDRCETVIELIESMSETI